MKIPLRNTVTHYGLISQLLHWAVVVLIVLQFVWAWRIDQTESVIQTYRLTVQHKSIGMTVLMLAAVRLAWRLFNPPPPLPARMPRWEAVAAKLSHGLLYALIFAMPLTGWAYSSAAGYGAEWFGWIDFPDFVGESERLENFFGRVHGVLAVTLVIVVAVHVLAALRHHFILRNPVLKRMLPTWK